MYESRQIYSLIQSDLSLVEAVITYKVNWKKLRVVAFEIVLWDKDKPWY